MAERVFIPKDAFVIAQGESKGLPDIWIVNRALTELQPKAAFAWHLSIIVDCRGTFDNGMPTKDEMEVMRGLDDAFDTNLTKDHNAVILARITWNRTRQHLYRVHDPEIANAYLQSVIKAEKPVREFDYRMESDPNWALAEQYLSVISRFEG